MSKKPLPDLPGLKERRRHWKKRLLTHALTMGITSVVMGATPLAIYFLVYPFPSWILFIVSIALPVLAFLISIANVLRDYPVQWHIDFDQQVRRSGKENDRVAPD